MRDYRHNDSVTSVNGIGAVVIGGDYQGLAVVRSMGQRGVPVFVVDDERSIARFSRYVTCSLRVPDLRSEEATMHALLRSAQRFGLEGWVIFPTRDENVAAIARNRETLTERFRVPTPAWDVVRWAWDKRNTYRLAASLEIAHPRTWYSDTPIELDRIDADPPFVIKPAVKSRFLQATKAKAWRADSHEELRVLTERAGRIAGPEGFVIQELIPGDGRNQFAYCSFFKDGRAVGTMVACRRRQHPPEFGRSSTFVETTEEPSLESSSERFLAAIDYYGLVEIEYKWDPRSGEYKLLDFNARTWGYHSLGRRAGVDFPYLLFCDQVGRETPTCRASAGVTWMRLVTDLPTAALEISAGRLNVRGWLRSLRNLDTEAVFSREDPLPTLAEIGLLPYLYSKRGF
jgi:predicted ATP-grasp superfamily ATP-dependent carboligase